MVLTKKGVSPVVATILLLAITIVLAIIVFLWARGFINESAEKRGEPVDRACGDVVFEAGWFNSGAMVQLDLVNRGNIPIYGVELKEYGGPTVLPKQYLDHTIAAGEGDSITIDDEAFLDTIATGDSLLVVPIILGKTDRGTVPHTCDDASGFAIVVSPPQNNPTTPSGGNPQGTGDDTSGTASETA